MMYRSSFKGFTLIELLIVLILIGLSTSFVLPNLWQQFEQSKRFSEKKQLIAVMRFSKEYSVYKGKVLDIVISESALDVYESTENSNSDDSIDSDENEKDALAYEKERNNLKHIEFSTFSLEPVSYSINELNYFKEFVIVINFKGSERVEEIKI